MQRVNFGLAKLYACLSTCLSATIAFQYTSMQDGQASAVYIAVLVFAALGVLDAVVNDLMPSKYVAKRTLRWRYVIFVALAGAQLCWVYDAAVWGGFNLGMLRYALDVLVAVGVAVLDLRARYLLAHAQHERHHPAAARA